MRKHATFCLFVVIALRKTTARGCRENMELVRKPIPNVTKISKRLDSKERMPDQEVLREDRWDQSR